MNSASRRITKLQRHILRAIRAEMRRTLGPQPNEIRKYHRAYEKEFRGSIQTATKEQLVQDALDSNLVLLGDYHTFAQSQKTAIRLLRELDSRSKPIALGLEMIPSAYQERVDEYLTGKLDDEAFLSAIDYATNWGFPWKNFQGLLRFAKERQLPILALNSEARSLDKRDEHAAVVISKYLLANAHTILFVLYGDLHLARTHIPKYVAARLKESGKKARILTVFQNSESLYWKLADNAMAHSVDVLKLGPRRYCIMNSPPWVKLQSYLEWAESSELFETTEMTSNLADLVAERITDLAQAIDVKPPHDLGLSIRTVDDLTFLRKCKSPSPASSIEKDLPADLPPLGSLSRSERKAVMYRILGNRNVFVPGDRFLYLASASVNSLSESAALFLHSALSSDNSFYCEPRSHFFGAILTSMLAYFGSKVLNHKRKCNLESDFKAILAVPGRKKRLSGKTSESAHDRRHDRFQREVAKFVLRHLRSQRNYLEGGRYRAALSPPRGTYRIPVFLESTRALGSILGEKLYVSYVEGKISADRIAELFRTPFKSPGVARRQYFNFVKALHRAPLGHSSKLDLF